MARALELHRSPMECDSWAMLPDPRNRHFSAPFSSSGALESSVTQSVKLKHFLYANSCTQVENPMGSYHPVVSELRHLRTFLELSNAPASVSRLQFQTHIFGEYKVSSFIRSWTLGSFGFLENSTGFCFQSPSIPTVSERKTLLMNMQSRHNGTQQSLRLWCH